MISFAKLLEEHTRNTGLSNKVLAKLIGVTETTVNDWRTGKTRPPSRNKVLKCAKVLELSSEQGTEFLRTVITELLNEYMRNAGLSDEALVKQIGVTKETVMNWGTDKTNPPLPEKVLKCINVLELSSEQRMEFLRYVMTEFAELLDEYMRNAGLINEALAKQIGVNKMTVYNWRTGKNKNPPSREKILRCAQILKLAPKQRMVFFITAGILWEIPELIPVIGNPVIKPCQFFGREELLRKIYLAWNKAVPESIAIIGPKRSGKTSVLHYLKNLKNLSFTDYLRSDQPKGWSDNWLPHHVQMAFIDFQDANMFQPTTLMKDVLRQFSLDIPASDELADFSNILKNELTKPGVILIDNLEIGLEILALNDPFWWNMSWLGGYGKLSFVVTACKSPLELAQDKGKPSSFFRLFGHNLALSAFTEKEARELLEHSPKPFSSEEIEWMLPESGCWPEPLQKLCNKRLQELSLG
jgi:DNA-binding transcriptional regulator YiaG